MAPSRRRRGPSILKSAKTKTPLKQPSPGKSVLKSQLPKTSKVEVATPKVIEKSLKDLTPVVTTPRKPRTRRSLPSPQRSDEEPPIKQINLENKKEVSQYCSLKCCFCQKQLKDIDSFVSHCNSSHQQKISNLWIQCHVCQTYLPTEKILKAHCVNLHHVKAQDHTPSDLELYFCELCGQEFNQTINFSQHARMKHKEILEFTWIPCKICGVSFKWQDWLDKHLLKSHRQLRVNIVRLTRPHEKPKPEPAVLPKHKPIVCTLCPSTFFDPWMYINHANVYHRAVIQLDWIECPKCGLFIPSRDALQFHLILNHGEETASKMDVQKTKPIKCFSCVKTFFDPFGLMRHANEAHFKSIEEKWLICQACNQYFPSADVLQLHSILVHEDVNAAGPIKIECNFCAEEFNDPFMYYDHANSGHKLVNIWKACQKCDLHFPDMYTLQFHTVISHNSLTKKKESAVVWMGVLQNNKYLLQCVECEFTFVDPFKYHTHANKEHLEDFKSSWVECDLCQMIFPSDDTLLYHDLYYHGRRSLLRQEWEKNLTTNEMVPPTQFPECHLCNVKFANDKLLEQHIMKHSSNTKIKEKSTKCQFCNTTFISKSLYFNHANACHQNLIETFWTKCTLCKMYLPSKGDFHVHFFDAHIPAHEKRSSQFSCGFCILKFRTKRNLIEHANKWHQKQLAGGKWVECKFCQMFVMNKQQLFYHMKQVHSEKLPPGKIWRCKLCKKRFLSERTFNNHKACNQSSDSEAEDEDDIEDSDDDLNLNSNVNTSSNKGKGPEDPEMSDDDFEDSKFDLDVTVDTEEEDFTISNDDVANVETALQLVGRGKGSPVFCQFCFVVLDSMNLYLHHATNTHKSQIEELWAQCQDCSFYFPDEEILARHKYKYHEHPSDDEESEEGEADEPKEKPNQVDSQPVKAKEKSAPIKITMNIGRRKLEMQLKTKDVVGDAQSGGSLDQSGTGKQTKLRGPRRKPYGSKTAKELAAQQKMISAKKESSKKATEKVEAKDPLEVYKCVPCNKVFFKKNYLRKHDNRFHKVEKSCAKCGKMFLFLRDFEKHAAQESCDEPKKPLHVCSFCGKRFNMKYRLVSHVNLVHTQREAHYKCRVCSRTFAMASYLKSHCFRVHKINEDDPESLLEPAEENPADANREEAKPILRPDGDFECKDCGKRFGKREYAIRHYKLMHTELQMRECQICFKSFPTGSSFNKHVRRVHVRGYEVDCSICSRTFSTPSSLRIHMRTVHRDEQTVQVDDGPILSCDTCNVTFSDTSSLRNHFEFVHANQYTVHCQHCQQAFDDLDALEVHMNTDHQSSRSYKCSCCEMVFAERSACEQHIMSVHVGDERFGCKYCDQTFESETLLDHHLVTHQAKVTIKEEEGGEVAVHVKYEPSIVVELVPFGVPQTTNVDEDVFYDTVH